MIPPETSSNVAYTLMHLITGTRVARARRRRSLGQEVAVEAERVRLTTEAWPLEDFKASLRGEVLRPGDAGFAAACTVWNGMIKRIPALIVRCAGASDVISSVNFARQHQLEVAVRGGGHSVAGNAVCDDGLVIDLSRMKSVRVDPMARTARAEPGVLLGEFDRETSAFGLATTGGFVSTTGLAGLTLGGGIGWLMRSYGLTCDNLLSVDIVTANGRFLTASATENADLFWGVRGGGGNFGIVTSFEFQLHPVDTVLAGVLIYPWTQAREVLQFYRSFTRSAPDALTAYSTLTTMPGSAPVVEIDVCYNGPREQGERVIQPLRAFGPLQSDTVRPMAYREFQAHFDSVNRPGLHYWKSNFLADLTDAAIEAMIAHAARPKAARCKHFIALEHLGGAVGRVGEDDTAFSGRSAPYSLIISTGWDDAAVSADSIAWTRGVWEAMRPFASSTAYVNYLGDEGHDRLRAAYGAAKYERLVALKNKYDPTNFFHLNQNIKPCVRS